MRSTSLLLCIFFCGCIFAKGNSRQKLDSVAGLIYNGNPIILESLSNHFSGLPRLPLNVSLGADLTNPYKHYNNDRLFAFLKAFKPYREPGGQYEYSNLAVGLLGVVLERVAEDMLLYAKAQVGETGHPLTGTVKSTHEQTFVQGQTKVALGRHIIEPAGEKYFVHDRQAGGYACTFFFNPCTRNASYSSQWQCRSIRLCHEIDALDG